MEILLPQDPISFFHNWLEEARKTEPNDPEAMALATVNAESRPSVRMVLLKEYSDKGFVFYTNTSSRKADDLLAHPVAALCFHWKSRLRQVRVEGRVERASEDMADAYFATRHPLSKLGAWASRQSQPLASRAALEERVEEIRQKFTGEIPRPHWWGGYRVVPDSIEFWQQGEGRLHDRFLFTRKGEGWDLTRLNP
jgi:pyridoxamine 5'-phosphate oxidase